MLESRNLLSTFTVDHLADDLVGSGLSGSLRYCITNAADGDDIQFGDGVTGTINLTGALPNLTHSISIAGPGVASLTVRRDTGGYYRIFTVDSGKTVSLAGLTIANGFSYSGGGGILNSGTLTLTNATVSGNSGAVGGGVANTSDGTLTLTNVTISNNMGDSPAVYGAGITTYGTATLTNATVNGNTGPGIESKGGGTVTVNNSTFSGNGGAGIAINGTVTNCTISGNGGAGIGINGTVTNCMISGNAGPGIGINGTVTDCTISGNGGLNTEYGSGIVIYGTATVTDCTISGNGNLYLGGGIYIYTGATLTLNNSTVSGNMVGPVGDTSGYGAGISNFGSLTLNNSTVSGNTSLDTLNDEGAGGGIFNGAGTVTLNNSTVSGNSIRYILDVSGYGGGIWNGAGTVTLNNSTVSGNSASGGGGIVNSTHVFPPSGGSSPATLTLNNSTVSGNFAFGGGGIYNFSTLQARNTIMAGNTAPFAPDLSGNLGSLGHNLIGNTQGGSGFDPSDLLNVDPMLGPLQDNGGPTWTMALLPGSPALNAGDPTELGVPDQRGVVRSGGVNIGAYQASATAFMLTAPATAQAGTPFDVTVKAVDPFLQTAVGYTGTVTFSTTDPDPGVVLPANYTFMLADGGSHTFPDTGLGETTLITPGDQMLTVMDMADNTITGSATVTVTTGNAPLGRWAVAGQPQQPGTPLEFREPSRPEEVLVDRLFTSLTKGDAGLALFQPTHQARAEADRWGLDLFRADEPLGI
jgi:hypothetical protein